MLDAILTRCRKSLPGWKETGEDIVHATIASLIWAIALGLAVPAAAHENAVKIGVLSDMSSVYTDLGGQGSVEAAKLAIEEFGGSVLGKPIELVVADHQNKPDIGVTIARRWFENDNVDAIFDVPTSSVALAVNDIAGQAKKLVFFSTPIVDALTEARCSGYGMAWTWDTYSVTNTAVKAQLDKGLTRWFIIHQDYAAGIAFAGATRASVEAGGGKIVGTIAHTINTLDWSSYLLQAQASGADIILLTAGGTDLTNAMKQAREFGIGAKQQRLGTLYAVITDISSLGLEAMAGLTFVTASYWDLDDRARDFGKRFLARHKKMPTMFQAGVYSAVLQYLKAVKATGSDDADTVRKYLMSLDQIDDPVVRNGKLLANGRLIHNMYLAQVKTPAESTAPWDYFKILGTIPAAKAFRSAQESACPLLR